MIEIEKESNIISIPKDDFYDLLFELCNYLYIEPKAMLDSDKKDYITNWILQRYYYSIFQPSDSAIQSNAQISANKFFRDVKSVIRFDDLKIMMFKSIENNQRTYAKVEVLEGFLKYYGRI